MDKDWKTQEKNQDKGMVKKEGTKKKESVNYM